MKAEDDEEKVKKYLKKENEKGNNLEVGKDIKNENLKNQKDLKAEDDEEKEKVKKISKKRK